MISVWAAVAVLIVGFLPTLALAGPAIDMASTMPDEIRAESVAERNTRNEDSTPPNSVLPVSPAIAGLRQQPTSQREIAIILRAKAFLVSLGYDVGRLDERITAKYKAAIFRYQRAHGIAASGELDDTTRRNLGVVAE